MTSNTEKLDLDEALLLTEAYDVIAGSAWRHGLYALRDGSKTAFWITVDGKEEAGEAFVGYDLACAFAIYQMLVRGRVTACTLCDVVEDALIRQRAENE